MDSLNKAKKEENTQNWYVSLLSFIGRNKITDKIIERISGDLNLAKLAGSLVKGFFIRRAQTLYYEYI